MPDPLPPTGPDLLPPHNLSFGDGLRAPLKAMGYLLKHPKVLLVCLAPLAINLLILAPLCWWLFGEFVREPLETQFLPPTGTGWWQTALHYGGVGLFWALQGLAVLVAFLLFAAIIGAPFHDYASELVERDVLRDRPDLQAPGMSVLRSIPYSIAEALKLVLISLPPFLFAFALNFVPGIGTVFSVGLNLIFAAMFFTLDSFTYSLDRRQIKMARKWNWVKSHFDYGLGFGLLFVPFPCAFLFAPPLGAVAGTLSYCEVLQRKNPPPPPALLER